MRFQTARAFVRKFIEDNRKNPEVWSLQGFGMLRLYVTDTIRLHIWHPSYRAFGVSDIHTHPWSFESTIYNGSVVDRVYAHTRMDQQSRYVRQKIQCGPGGGLVDLPESVRLRVISRLEHSIGDTYSHTHSAIHQSEPTAGTVTICARTFEPDTEHAFVYWRRGDTWGTAEPRRATEGERAAIIGAALDIWAAS